MEGNDVRLQIQLSVVAREVILLAMESWLDGISEQIVYVYEDGSEMPRDRLIAIYSNKNDGFDDKNDVFDGRGNKLTPVMRLVRNSNAIGELFRNKMDRLCKAYGLEGGCGFGYRNVKGNMEGGFAFHLMTSEPLAFWLLEKDRVYWQCMNDRSRAIGGR